MTLIARRRMPVTQFSWFLFEWPGGGLESKTKIWNTVWIYLATA